MISLAAYQTYIYARYMNKLPSVKLYFTFLNLRKIISIFHAYYISLKLVSELRARVGWLQFFRRFIFLMRRSGPGHEFVGASSKVELVPPVVHCHRYTRPMGVCFFLGTTQETTKYTHFLCLMFSLWRVLYLRTNEFRICRSRPQNHNGSNEIF